MRELLLGVVASAVLVAVSATAAAAEPEKPSDKWVYLQRQDGVRTYSDIKPAHGPYTKIVLHGRPTASASCLGIGALALEQRAKSYETLIRKHALSNGLSPQLVSAVMRVESCYDHKAVSRVGARGLMQLMPFTAAQLGVHDSFNPDENIGGGVRYLASLYNRFHRDLKLTLAAYNAGPDAVEAYHGVPPYPETTSYVSRILKLYKAY